MSSSSTLLLDVDLQPGSVPTLRADAAGDGPRWAAVHRDALRAVVAEHGAVLVHGLGLRDAVEVAAVFRGLTTAGLMTEREAFAERQTYAEGVYSSSKWPPNQPMCMHHELSYRLEFPGLMQFACLSAPTKGGATGVADSTAVLGALPGDLVKRLEREGWMLVRNYNEEIGASVAEAFGTEDRGAVESYCHANAIEFSGNPMEGCAPGSAAARWCGTRSPVGAAGSTRSPSSTSGRSTLRCTSSSSTPTAPRGCRSPPASGAATR